MNNFMKRWNEAKKKADEITKGKNREIIEKIKQILPSSKKTYNIHKRSLPVGIDKVIVYNLESYQEARYLIDTARNIEGKHLFKTKVLYDEETKTKIVIYYDVVLADAKLYERNVFYNAPETKILKGN